MEKIKKTLLQTKRLLKQDVFSFRQVILQSEGGQLPREIIQKQHLLKKIEALLAQFERRPHANR